MLSDEKNAKKRTNRIMPQKRQEGKDARKGGLRRYQEGFEFEVQKQKNEQRKR